MQGEMNAMRTPACAAVSGLALLIAACRGAPPKPPPPPPPPAHAALVVAKDANPDASGRPSPVVLRLYELKEEGAFNHAEYFALIDKEQDALGASLIAREEYELRPGETRELELNIPPEARFVAATVGFWDIRNAKWKTLAPASAQSTSKLTVSIGKHEVAIAAGK
jgi:type VI secretion system protein VasD